MKKLLVAMFVALLMVGCGGDGKSGSDGSESNESSAETPPAKSPEVPKIDLDDNETRKKIIAEAIDEDKLQFRDMKGEELAYAPDQQTPYTGWGKVIYSNGHIWRVNQYKDGKDDGPSTSWYSNGRKKWETTYKDGKPMSIVVWKPNGEKCPVSNVDKDGNEVVVLYNDDGSEYTRTTYKDSEPVSN